MTSTCRAALLDEYAAWVEMAMLCEGPVNRFGEIEDGHTTKGRFANGLCQLTEEYGAALRRLIRHHIDRQPRFVGARIDFKWPSTYAGWRSRARFCWDSAAEMARELDGGA